MCAGGEWNRCSLATEIPLTFRSVHNRVSIGRPLIIFHTLLEFSMRGRSQLASGYWTTPDSRGTGLAGGRIKARTAFLLAHRTLSSTVQILGL